MGLEPPRKPPLALPFKKKKLKTPVFPPYFLHAWFSLFF